MSAHARINDSAAFAVRWGTNQALVDAIQALCEVPVLCHGVQNRLLQQHIRLFKKTLD
jgi:hypothetical protein